MFVSGWMTEKVYTVSPEESISEVIRLMKEKGIKHIPVVRNGKLKGILSDRDIREFSPSKATALDVYEVHYLLGRTKVKSLMKTDVCTVSPDTPVEVAASIMFDRDIGCLPVIEKGSIAGIISDKDIFKVLIDITGVRHGGNRISLTVKDSPGSIREVADIIRKRGYSLQSILTSYENVKAGYRDITIRTKGEGDFRGLRAELETSYAGVRITRG